MIITDVNNNSKQTQSAQLATGKSRCVPGSFGQAQLFFHLFDYSFVKISKQYLDDLGLANRDNTGSL